MWCRLRTIVPALVGGLLLAGCGKPQAVVEVPTQKEANEILVLFDDAGVREAALQPVTRQRNTCWAVTVPREHVRLARRVLEERSLPRARQPGFEEMLKQTGWIPGRADDRARETLARSGELAGLFEALDRVIEARVCVVLPEEGVLPGTPTPAPSAAVLIKYAALAAGEPARSPDGDAAAVAATDLPIEPLAAQKLAAAAIPGLRLENVQVHYTRVASRSPTRAARVDPAAPSPGVGSALAAKEPWLFGAIVALGAAVVALLGVNWWRVRQLRQARGEAAVGASLDSRTSVLAAE